MDSVRELAEAADPSAAEAIAALERLAALGRHPPPAPSEIDHELQKTKPSAAVLVPLFIGRSNTLYVLLSRFVPLALLLLAESKTPRWLLGSDQPLSAVRRSTPPLADRPTFGRSSGGAIIFADTLETRRSQEARSSSPI